MHLEQIKKTKKGLPQGKQEVLQKTALRLFSVK